MSVVGPDGPAPRFRTVRLSVRAWSSIGLLSLSVGVSTTRSGAALLMSVLPVAMFDAGPVPAELMAETW